MSKVNSKMIDSGIGIGNINSVSNQEESMSSKELFYMNAKKEALINVRAIAEELAKDELESWKNSFRNDWEESTAKVEFSNDGAIEATVADTATPEEELALKELAGELAYESDPRCGVEMELESMPKETDEMKIPSGLIERKRQEIVDRIAAELTQELTDLVKAQSMVVQPKVNRQVQLTNVEVLINTRSGQTWKFYGEFIIYADDLARRTEEGSIILQEDSDVMPLSVTGGLDLTLEDFSNGPIEVKFGKKVIEITIDDFLERQTNGGSVQDKMRYLNDNEIIYGHAQDGFDVERAEHLEVEDSESVYSEVVRSYGYRGRDERKYYFEKYRTLLSREFKSVDELIAIAEGVVIPKKLSAAEKNHANQLVKDGKLDAVVHLAKDMNGEGFYGKWILPLNCLTKSDRDELKDMYYSAVNGLVYDLIDELNHLAKNPSVLREFVAKNVTQEIAKAVLRAAFKFKEKNNSNMLDYTVYRLLSNIKEGVKINVLNQEKVKVVMDKYLSIKDSKAEARTEKVKSSFTKEEARIALDYGKQVLVSENRKIFDLSTYRTLVAISNQ